MVRVTVKYSLLVKQKAICYVISFATANYSDLQPTQLTAKNSLPILNHYVGKIWNSEGKNDDVVCAGCPEFKINHYF